jgi:hypothetical protein
MKRTIALTLVLMSVFSLFGQEKNTDTILERNTLYAEAFGQGFCYSINYDRLFNTEKIVKNSFTAGFVYVPDAMGFGDGVYFGVPISYNWLLGKKSHHLELGIGLTSLIVNPNSNIVSHFYTYLSPKMGYRFQRPTGGLFLRVTATAMIDIMNFRVNKIGTEKFSSISAFKNVVGLDYAVFPWPGLSIGYTFK